MVAALIMRLWVSREGLKGSLGILRHWKYYVVALFAPMLYTALLVLMIVALGQCRFGWSGQTPLFSAIPLLILKSFQGIPLGIGEEYGWRGYLLPRLMPIGEVRATIILGLIWSFWHLPIMMFGLNYPGQDIFISSIVFVLFVVLVSFPFTWLFMASNGSVMVAALCHITLDVFADTFCSPEHLTGGSGLLASSGGLISCAVLTIMIVCRYTLFGHHHKSEN